MSRSGDLRVRSVDKQGWTVILSLVPANIVKSNAERDRRLTDAVADRMRMARSTIGCMTP